MFFEFHSGETFYFDPNRLNPVIENRRYTFRATNGQIHVVDVITDQFGTSTRAYQIENGNGFKQQQQQQPQTKPTNTLSVKEMLALPSLGDRLDATSLKFVNHHQYRFGSLLSHGFTSVLPAQTQFQHIFMPSPVSPTSIVIPFAVVFNPYAGLPSSPSLIHNSEKPIDPELINSIFQVPTNGNAINNNNNYYAGGISTSLQPPYQTSTPPNRIPSTTLKPSTSTTGHYNYFGTSSAPTRPGYLPPTESAVNDFDIRKFNFASTGKMACQKY